MGLCNFCADTLNETPTYSVQDILDTVINDGDTLDIDCERCNIAWVGKYGKEGHANKGNYFVAIDDEGDGASHLILLTDYINYHLIFDNTVITKDQFRKTHNANRGTVKQYFLQ